MTLSLDLCPTLAELGGTTAPKDRIIDGKDVRPLLFGEENASTPHDAFFYYRKDVLEAIRSGKWKLHLHREPPRDKGNPTVDTGNPGGVKPVKELYNLESDIGETENVYDQYPDVVTDLEAKAQACREDLGDQALEIEGANVRPAGRVENPDTLTHLDPEHPYMIAMYDLKERG